MPTGVALRDVRQQLFDAAERILLRDGPSALTSRAVTDEAGVAKGVLHKHFADFDGFLADFVLDRFQQTATGDLPELVGVGSVAENVTNALTALFSSVALAIVPLVTFRDELRTRLRETWPAGIPVLTDGAIMLGEYLAAEQRLGRVDAYADPETLGAMLIGTAHLRFADRSAGPPTPEAVRTIVDSVLR
ncbi:MAG: TetR/AcrR family transcriptional regulator [Hamadaea sp.]|uniref:TetR/AcrR family transcriptional regulator n=1 Tax=Hamadaea sp. TaxID=2024425 RepID=UPI0017A3AD52|nr:TetR/AcrR family transcriptional regulator [Hamadaea sp.]NUR71741.1 TetR/AcrR family transcriptional regulator [Hamadaea sp.]NUT19055.1 TetR/AcrR family transcriptional regulator [Hamadaea sp.]